MTDMVPPKLLEARSTSFGIGNLLSYRDGHRDRRDYSPDAFWLFDTIIPPFQRALVWDEEMMVRFIESAWMGMDIGRYVVNDAMDAPSRQHADGRIQWHPTDRWLIDGQQRLTAIDRYVHDGFPLRGGDGRLHLWSDLSVQDHRKFESIPFTRCITRIYSELDLRVLYDRMNYGGVAHTSEQRALPDGEPENWKPSQRMR